MRPGRELPRPSSSPSPPTDRSSESTGCVTTLSARAKTGATAATTPAPHPRTPVHHAQYISMVMMLRSGQEETTELSPSVLDATDISKQACFCLR
jgi:hypothetical protein